MIALLKSGAGGGSRTRVLALGRPHNSRYTTPAANTFSQAGLPIFVGRPRFLADIVGCLEPPWGVEPQTSALRKRHSSQLS